MAKLFIFQMEYSINEFLTLTAKSRYKKNGKIEENVHLRVCGYLKMLHPDVIFMSDIASGMRMSIGQAVKAKKFRSSRGQPDLFIAKPSRNMHGLFIEIKKEGTKIYLKDGETVVSDPHIQEQWAILDELRLMGYAAEFGIGYDECIRIIESYLK